MSSAAVRVFGSVPAMVEAEGGAAARSERGGGWVEGCRRSASGRRRCRRAVRMHCAVDKQSKSWAEPSHRQRVGASGDASPPRRRSPRLRGQGSWLVRAAQALWEASRGDCAEPKAKPGLVDARLGRAQLKPFGLRPLSLLARARHIRCASLASAAPLAGHASRHDGSACARAGAHLLPARTSYVSARPPAPSSSDRRTSWGGGAHAPQRLSQRSGPRSVPGRAAPRPALARPGALAALALSHLVCCELHAHQLRSLHHVLVLRRDCVGPRLSSASTRPRRTRRPPLAL